MGVNRNFIIIFLLIIFILTTCQGKKQTEENISFKKLRLEEKIKEQTEIDLKRIGLKNILLYKNGEWSSGIEDYRFMDNGEVFIKPSPSAGFHKEGKLYWKVENNELYINPKNYNYRFFIGNKFIKMSVEAIKPGFYSGINDLKRIKYALSIMKNKDEGLSLNINVN